MVWNKKAYICVSIHHDTTYTGESRGELKFYFFFTWQHSFH